MQDVSISDTEFASILNEVEQYYSLKEGQRKNNSLIFLEKVDDATLREEIKKEFQKKLSSLLTPEKSWEFKLKENQTGSHCLYLDINTKDMQIRYK